MLSAYRIQQWWRPKAGLLIGLMLFATSLSSWRVDFIDFLLPFALSLVTLLGIGSFGHLLNDWADIKSDKLAAKNNRLTSLNLFTRLGLLLACLIAAVLPWLWLPFDNYSIALLGFEAFLLIAYALPPLRFKRFPILALFSDALYAYVVPTALALHTYDLLFTLNILKWTYIPLTIWMLVAGLRHILYHHVADRDNDQKSNTPNISLRYSVSSIEQLIAAWLLPLEWLAAIVFFVFIEMDMHSWATTLSLAAFVMLFGLRWISVRNGKLTVRHSLGFHSIDRFYMSGWAIVMSVFLLLMWGAGYLMALLFVLLSLTAFANHPVWAYAGRRIWSAGSFTINHGIYYFRKWILRWDEKRNRGKYYDNWVERKRLAALDTIAILNQNKSKYTETFVDGHVSHLPYNIEHYYGSGIPHIHAIDGDLLGSTTGFSDFARGWRSLLMRDERSYVLRQLAIDIKGRNVKLILCEFGTVGAEVVDIPALTGMPLICIFYGYDAWNKSIIIQHQYYKKLFQQASCIIGVSRDICQQLIKMGCPESKVAYVPCFVDMKRFTPLPSVTNNNRILILGRFAETKAPQLSLLAFAEVVKRIPDAKLVMAGYAGRDDLFEGCLEMLRALKLEGHVVLKGTLSPAEVRYEMEQANLFIQHSVTTPIQGDKEGTPVAIMEAMASGLPIVATRHAGIAEMIVDDRNGFLVDEYDYKAMAARALQLLNDKDLCQRMGKQAAEDIRANELVTGHLRRLTEIIEQYKLT